MSGGGCAAVALAAVLQPEARTTPEPPFVPGEVIVSFRRGSEAEGLVAQAVAGDPAGTRKLEAYLESACAKAGIPARMKRLASGRDVLLALDFGGLTTRLVSALGADRGVARAALVSGEGKDPPEVRVELREEAPGLVDRVARDLGLPLRSRFTAERELLVAVDAEASTRALVDRLRRRDDVAYAQPNYVLRKFSRP